MSSARLCELNHQKAGSLRLGWPLQPFDSLARLPSEEVRESAGNVQVEAMLVVSNTSDCRLAKLSHGESAET
jgi:hypothetical protein